MEHLKKLDPQHTGLLVVDIQEKMMPVIAGRDEVIKNSVLLLKAARVLKMPVVATTQYGARIGALLPGIVAELGGVTPLDKLEFDCFANRAIHAHLHTFDRVETWIVCGVETHICMYQTVQGGLQAGYAMWVPADAVSSRTEKNYLTGLERIRQIGGLVGNTEMIIYELLGRAGTPEFKELLPFIK